MAYETDIPDVEIQNNDCGCNDNYYSSLGLSDWDYFCKHDDLTHRNMETWICDNPAGGSRHNPCWCHLGIHTYFVGKDGIYSFSNIEGETRHTEMCGWGNPGTEDMSICDNFNIWPIDGSPWDPDSWQWYLETSVDGIHWELVSKYPFDKIKQTTPFGPTSVSSRDFRFVRLRMPTDRRGVGLSGYMDNSRFNINEGKKTSISDEGLLISKIEGQVKAHKYRSMTLLSMLVQVSYDGTSDWETVHEFNIENEQLKSFSINLDAPKLARFVRILPQSGMWNGMPATPAFLDKSIITITYSGGSVQLNCEDDTMECSLSPIHCCWSGGEGYNGGSYNQCENYMMSGSFHHTYPLLSRQSSNSPPSKPSKPSGETNCELGLEYSYTTSSSDSQGNKIYYMYDFEASGSHHLKPWQGPYNSGNTVSAKHSWDESGSYIIRVKAKDSYGYESSWSEALAITVEGSENQEPQKPNKPNGPASGEPGIEYTYTTSCIDPDSDKVYFKWDWDGIISDWDGPYNSGEQTSKTHAWSEQGQYIIKVKAKDEQDAESEWS